MPFLTPSIPLELRTAIGAATTVEALIISSPEVARFIFWAKVTGIVLTLVFASLIAILIIKMIALGAKIRGRRMPFAISFPAVEDRLARDWARVRSRLDKATDADDRLAVIEADQILDQALKAQGIPGDTMASRLENLKPLQLSNLSDVWVAHKMRNRLVHEPSSRISRYEAETAVKIFEKALKELGVL